MSVVRRILAATAVTVGVVLVAARPASAHLMNTGFGPFYDGLAHPFVTPEDLLPVIALTLLAGLRGPRFGRVLLFALPAAWLAGTVAGYMIAPPATHASALATAALTIALGAFVATDARLPLAAVAGAAIALGLLNGGTNGSELAMTRADPTTAVGIAGALFVVVSLAAGHVGTLRTSWARIAVRVAGSWIAAIGLLILGWSVRGA